MIAEHVCDANLHIWHSHTPTNFIVIEKADIDDLFAVLKALFPERFGAASIDCSLTDDGLLVVCRKCKIPFNLTADKEDGQSTYVKMLGCDSGGIYATYVDCPHCGARTDLHS